MYVYVCMIIDEGNDMVVDGHGWRVFDKEGKDSLNNCLF